MQLYSKVDRDLSPQYEASYAALINNPDPEIPKDVDPGGSCRREDDPLSFAPALPLARFVLYDALSLKLQRE